MNNCASSPTGIASSNLTSSAFSIVSVVPTLTALPPPSPPPPSSSFCAAVRPVASTPAAAVVETNRRREMLRLSLSPSRVKSVIRPRIRVRLRVRFALFREVPVQRRTATQRAETGTADERSPRGEASEERSFVFEIRSVRPAISSTSARISVRVYSFAAVSYSGWIHDSIFAVNESNLSLAASYSPSFIRS